MATRCSALISLGFSLMFATGCPEPGDETGDDWGPTDESGESGETGIDDPTTDDGSDEDGGAGVEEGGDVRPPLDTGDGDEGDDAGDGDGDGDGDGGVIDDPDRCWDRTWNEHALPAVIFDNTIGRVDDATGSCGIGAAPDFELGFLAPWTGSFTFDTEGSSFDTVVYVHEGECGAREITCNDDFVGLDSKVTVFLKEAQMVTVTVDGAGPFEEGPLVLNITEADPPMCETQMIAGNLPKKIIGDTTDAPSELESTCGGASTRERIYEFHAQGPGTYRFDTAGSSFDTVLYTLESCDQAPTACNDDANFELSSELILDLAGGQKLLVVVDGHEPDEMGEFILGVEKL